MDVNKHDKREGEEAKRVIASHPPSQDIDSLSMDKEEKEDDGESLIHNTYDSPCALLSSRRGQSKPTVSLSHL